MEVSEELRSKLYDLERWETVAQESTQGLDFRLQRLEEIAEQTSTQLSVIHRFMAASSADVEDGDEGSESTSEDEKRALDTGVKSPSQVGAEKEMKQILERSASFRPKQPEHQRGTEKEEGATLSRQETLESGGQAEADEVAKEEVLPRKDDTTTEAEEVGRSPTRKISFARRRPKQRHISSGGSSTAAEQAAAEAAATTRPRPSKRRARNSRLRKATESSEEDASYRAMLGLHGQQTLSDEAPEAFARCKSDSEDGEEDKEGEEEEAEMSSMVGRPTSANIYRRAQSEVTTSGHLPVISAAGAKLGRMMSIDVGGGVVMGTRSSGPEESDSAGGAEPSSSLRFFHHRRKLSGRHRMASTTRDYTSITDELEDMIQPSTASAAAVAAACARSVTPEPPPAIKIEVETLHDAEETDYNLMESLIEKRLRRDSHNLEASLEDLVSDMTKRFFFPGLPT